MESESTTWKGTSLPELEKQVIHYWRSINATDKIINQTKEKQQKVFLDGPPFATGKMHYGHILVSTIKDTLTRYLTMHGYYVDRKNGWDTHGVPIEMLAKKTIGYNTKKELLEFGLDKHNDVCRNLVLQCADQWYKDFERIGRWVDTKREYKTMDLNFMESVIWSFKELYNKGLIFEGYKVMPYSTGCNTPLSHFEAKQNYKDTTDPSVICCFEIVSTQYSNFKCKTDYQSYILAWTTTPWTLPSNMAICTFMNGEIIYAFDYLLQCYILMSKEKYEMTYAKQKYNNVLRFSLIERLASYDLVNVEYKPPFDYFWKPGCQEHLPIEKRAFRVISDHFVKEDGQAAGTGFVHCAPAHGEEDFRVCCENNIIDNKNSGRNLINPMDDDGCFTSEVPPYAGMYVKKVDQQIIKDLKAKKLLFDSKPYTHSYPFCYRTDTPLLYKVVSAWFLNAANEKFREKMLANNKKINWMPSSVGTNHFDNWLQGSVDWCISRSRYWGTPIPVWRSDDGEEIVCIGSIAELEELSGIKGISDLHIEYVDKIKIPSKQGKGMLSRVQGVLDCWFESGSMPYAQLHYPFENKELLDPSHEYISDFITESKDQTRGWFYTLTVLATALFDKPAFQNVIVTGIINGSDGQKMAKSKGNYPDPNILMDKYGADTLRLYLLSTPVVKAESIKFDEAVLAKLQQNSIVKLYNMALFLVEKINLYNRECPTDPINYPSKADLQSLDDILDRWIINKTGLLLQNICMDLDSYKVNSIASKILAYIEQLTNWYLKMARERMKGFASRYNDIGNNTTWKQSLQTLLFVMLQFTKMISPVTPFISETIYSMLKLYINNPKESVHFETYPKSDEFVYDEKLEVKFDVVQKVMTLIREVRDNLKFNHRRPIGYVEVGCIDNSHWEIIQDILDYVKSESNVMTLRHLDIEPLIIYKAEVIVQELSQYLKENGHIKSIKQIMQFVSSMDKSQIEEFKSKGFVIEPTTNVLLNDKHIVIRYINKENDPATKIYDGILVRLDTSYTEEIKTEHLIRLINTAIQMHRKETGLKPWDVITIQYYCYSFELTKFIHDNSSKFECKNISYIGFVTNTDLLGNNKTSHDIMGSVLFLSSVQL
ncbi:isoleucyl-tRNA synthetase [Tupanvirus soda lake]|uniref:isoleucine--tRNA ligase n=2 Tax=Tupanvirus TaxID=2094720 RepID=A0A6N1NLX5_9VIRU|nr:isoleucyl-tRNA synthetase [Tupanvirus soda lake]QKU35514.1 isoleucyl-tRNA synthetase [Tupanvirus soda lake]